MDKVPEIEALKAKHAELEAALNAEAHRPHPDAIVISDIKKHKLRIKDQIARLSQG